MRLTPLVLGCALVVFGVVLGFYGVSPQKSIVIFDKKEVLSQFIRQLAEAKATESQVEQSTRRFNALLNKVLVDTAQQKKVIILRASDVLAGGVDITDEMRIKMSHAMRNKL
ncbi:TPA: type-F conjugative transfer system protein TrbI [Legionella pneumophila]|uniref:type-F conjugative transfer system protein TrbI n=1 Tax=Legionella pneumophila TaxID=446 RepID=UPI0013750DD6|nr:type-F conjugative transfer system protein TrbI [Legionella pneumophila]HCC3258015.1 type-F conjugative transfer system protein TrbI [Legionella pneumophila subsp. pneumophila]UAK70105.1 type-F conjugative transfer system protein TrbI [Legionella pneumophila]HAT1812543.1 type-F conjugative transfer system protein TrbI [Legionella pneumophila]HAT1874710.1 type-F conjugative transfer system protein TrbI [Legionella pneumophila]HAT3873753.1 type-F conjugative transfer system protein TrbI [Legi